MPSSGYSDAIIPKPSSAHICANILQHLLRVEWHQYTLLFFRTYWRVYVPMPSSEHIYVYILYTILPGMLACITLPPSCAYICVYILYTILPGMLACITLPPSCAYICVYILYTILPSIYTLTLSSGQSSAIILMSFFWV
jgi:hypothetical protein